MSSVIVTPLINGERNVVLHVYIKGDGLGDVEDYELADPADYGMTGEDRFFTIDKIQSGLSGFSATLKFEYLASDTLIWAIPEFHSDYDFTCHGGLKDRSSVLDGTGKILISTSGLANGDHGSFVIKLRK